VNLWNRKKKGKNSSSGKPWKSTSRAGAERKKKTRSPKKTSSKKNKGGDGKKNRLNHRSHGMKYGQSHDYKKSRSKSKNKVPEEVRVIRQGSARKSERQEPPGKSKSQA